MSKLTPEQAQDKLARRLKAATQDIQSGVAKVTEAPGAKAAAKQDKMLNNLTAAVQSGKWAQRVKSVTVDDWKTQMTNKGIPRIAAGIDGAKQKSIDFFSQLLPYQDSLKSQLNQMPDLTLEDSISRVGYWIRNMSKFQRK
jgi:hypothetical protein